MKTPEYGFLKTLGRLLNSGQTRTLLVTGAGFVGLGSLAFYRIERERRRKAEEERLTDDLFASDPLDEIWTGSKRPERELVSP